MNKYRGESRITIGSETYTLRPTFEACVEFEEAAGLSVFQALNQLSQGTIKVRTIVSAIHAGMMGHDPKGCPSWNEVGRMLHRHGAYSFLEEVGNFLGSCVTSEEDLARAEEDAGKKSEAGDEAGTGT